MGNYDDQQNNTSGSSDSEESYQKREKALAEIAQEAYEAGLYDVPREAYTDALKKARKESAKLHTPSDEEYLAVAEKMAARWSKTLELLGR